MKIPTTLKYRETGRKYLAMDRKGLETARPKLHRLRQKFFLHRSFRPRYPGSRGLRRKGMAVITGDGDDDTDDKDGQSHTIHWTVVLVLTIETILMMTVSRSRWRWPKTEQRQEKSECTPTESTTCSIRATQDSSCNVKQSSQSQR